MRIQCLKGAWSQDNFGKPSVHRSFAQISQQARQLREDLGIVSTHAERSAASDLLSGAVDTIALSKQLGQFQVQPELAVPEPEEAGSVQEFVEKLRQRNIENAIQVSTSSSDFCFFCTGRAAMLMLPAVMCRPACEKVRSDSTCSSSAAWMQIGHPCDTVFLLHP